ncbi:MAG: hypothetical protein J6D28_04905 [Bacilli bacterium]|nr:hypothetical protein [Bacilli bacterium]
MVIIDAHDLQLQQYKILQMKENAGYVLCHDNKIIKIFDDRRIQMLDDYGIDLEEKILASDDINIDFISLPTGIIYDNDRFVGYQMSEVDGICYGDILYENMSLYDYARVYERFEQILDSASEQGIIITDFANSNNIYFSKSLDDIMLIDYDDMQVGFHRTITYSSNIASALKDTPKYYHNGLYTRELNKLSLVYFYFSDVLNFKLKRLEQEIGNINFNFNKTCHMLGLMDRDIIDVLSLIYNQREKNPMLNQVFYEIANRYDLNLDDDGKVLIKK